MWKSDGNYEYEIGQDIGLTGVINNDDVVWYKLLAIEQDDELPLAWFYLSSETEKLNDKSSNVYGMYADMIESISDRIVVN